MNNQMSIWITCAFLTLVIVPMSALGQTAPATSVYNYPGAGVIQAGDVWESFLPQGYGPNYSEASSAPTLGVRRFVQMGNFDRNWSTPATHWPAAFYMTPYWWKDNWVTVYDPDTTWNRGPASENPSYFPDADLFPGRNYNLAAQLTYKSTLTGASDPTRHYSIEPYFVDGTLRQHVVYEAAWPTQLGVDVKMRAHGFAAPNWNNLNDYVIVEVELKNTGFLDMNMDGVAEQLNHNIKALAFMVEEQAYMSIGSYGGGGRNSNDIVPAIIARQAGWVNDVDPSGNPWAFSMVFPSATTYNPTPGTGYTDIGFNGGSTKNYMDQHHGWVVLDVKAGGLPADRSRSTSTLASKNTIFGTHPIGQGTSRGWYMSGGSSYWAGPSGAPAKVFYVSTGVWYQNGGQLSHNYVWGNLNLSPNPNFFASGATGNPLTFVARPSPAKPNGDFKSTNTFDQASFEDGKADAITNYPTGWGTWSQGCSNTENFDTYMFTGVGPFELKKDSTIVIVYATVAGYRLEGIQRAVRAARWAYELNFVIPQPPPVPDVLVSKIPLGLVTVEWDNRAESDAEFAGYKIWRATQADSVKFLDEGMRIVDRYQEQMTVGPRPVTVYKPVNPKFDAAVKTLANATHGAYAPDTWGTWTLQKTILKSELGSTGPASSPGYTYKWIDSTVQVGFSRWYYVSAFKEGSYAGPGGEVTNRIETHSTNRNGASGLWRLTYPFAFNNANFPKDAGGRKNIGAGVLLQPVLTIRDLDFGSVNFGASQPLDVKLVNSADDSLRIDLTCSQGSFLPFPNSLVIGPNDDSIVVIRFTPAKLGTDSGLVILTTNGLPSKDTIAVRGTGGSGLNRAVLAWGHSLDTAWAIPSGAYVALDASGNIYAADISSPTLPPYMSRVTKYDPTGAVLWTTRDTIRASIPAVIGLQMDADGSLYLVTNGGTTSSSPWYGVFCITRYSSNGQILWRREYVPYSSGQIGVGGFAVDPAGNIVVTGWAYSSPGNNPKITTVKYSRDGALQWFALYDGLPYGYDSSDVGRAVALDSAGNVYVAGTTGSTTNSWIVTIKYNQSGLQQWVKLYKGLIGGTDNAADISADLNGDVYVLGNSTSSGTGTDILVLKYRGVDGMGLWEGRWDGVAHGNDVANACMITRNQMILVSGSVIVQGNASNAVLLKCNPGGSGSLLVHYAGPAGVAYGGGLCEDRNGFVYFSGRCIGTLGNSESFAFKADTSGEIAWEAHYTINPAAPTIPVDLAVDGSGNLVLSGYYSSSDLPGYSYFLAKFGEVPAGVYEKTETLPTSAELYQNYPNPFNPSTLIRYVLPKRSQADLTVYNILGQQVTVLVQGEQEAGSHEVRFDGSGLSSGVYFYRLRAGDFVQSKKLLLLK